MRRALMLAAAVAMLMATMVAPAGATKPDDSTGLVDGHKITICHATRSLSNPYVEITIDIAAWNDPSDDKNHGDHHTRTKQGITWKDYELLVGQECGLTPPGGTCAGREVDWVAEFTLVSTGGGSYESLAPWRQTMVSDSVFMPAGTYDVVLGTWDDSPNGETPQDNEQWRASFGDGVYSDFSADLGTNEGRPTAANAVPKNGGSVTLAGDVTSITAQHWTYDKVPETDTSYRPVNSVNPRCVGLIAR
jgi:hypothetical protein